MDPQPRGPDWMPITPKTGSLFHADSQFSAEGVVRYVEQSPAFPFVSCQRGQRLSALPSPVDDTGLSVHEEGSSRDWLVRPGRDALVVQTLNQRRGYAITLLAFEAAGSDDHGEVI